jgi:SAM-dependent methyltransferase
MARNRIKDTLEALHDHGPLGTLWRILAKARGALDGVPGVRGALLGMTRGTAAFQQYLDRSYDRRYGTDTAGIIATKDLQIERGSRVLGNWYEPVSENIFGQIMRQIRFDPKRYECVDLGSGKGRGLIMAAEFGFPKVVGVEFARDLHVIAQRNIKIYEERIGRPSGVSVVCLDAQEYEIPEGNLFIFFYSPFTGSVMERVVNNIRASYLKNRRPVIIVFYGRNKESLEDLDTLKFGKREIPLRADWTRLNMFRVWVYESAEAAALR